VADVANFYRKSKEVGITVAVTLLTPFPKKVLEDPTAKLADLKFGKQESLIV
jgi:hypothetical protein